MKRIFFVAGGTLLLAAGGCVTKAPRLTWEQSARLGQITAYKPEETPPKQYKELAKVSGADCHGAPGGGRVWGNAERALNTMIVKAAALNADAVVNVTCGAVPLLNNCWAAQECSGMAVAWR